MLTSWVSTTLGDCAEFLSGGTPSKSRRDYWEGTIPWVSAKDMKRFQLDDTEDHVTNDGAQNGTKLVPSRTVLLLTRGMTLLNDVPICVAGRPMTFNQDVKAVHAKAHLDQEFLPYLLLGHKERLLSLVDLAGHGTGRLNTADLKALEIVLPPITEQREIARLLAALDQKIDVNQRMIVALEGIARAVFKSWFLDFEPVQAKMEGRDPGLPAEIASLFPDRLVGSEIGEIPDGWIVVSLDQMGRFLNGLAMQKFPPRDGPSLPVIKIAQLHSGNVEGADRASANLDKDYIVEDGDILFSWSGSLECVLWSGGRGALNQHLFNVTSTHYPRWLLYLAIHHHLEGFRQIAAGKATTMGHIQRHHLAEAKMALPPLALLHMSDGLISPLIESQWRRALESHMLARIRDELLPRLISGEIRLDAGREAVEA